MKSMKNIKPAYAVKLGKGVFAAESSADWHCKYCFTRPSSGSTDGRGGWHPVGNSACRDSPTGKHVWEHN